MSPINARNPENFDYIFEKVNGKIIINEGSKNCKFKIGDKVRKIIKGNIFSKGYIQRFSDEIFIITDVKFVECPIYFINDEWFYENELVKISS